MPTESPTIEEYLAASDEYSEDVLDVLSEEKRAQLNAALEALHSS